MATFYVTKRTLTHMVSCANVLSRSAARTLHLVSSIGVPKTAKSPVNDGQLDLCTRSPTPVSPGGRRSLRCAADNPRFNTARTCHRPFTINYDDPRATWRFHRRIPTLFGENVGCRGAQRIVRVRQWCRTPPMLTLLRQCIIHRAMAFARTLGLRAPRRAGWSLLSRSRAGRT